MATDSDTLEPVITRHVNSIELQVVETGPTAGAPVILLHGFPETSWAWRNQIPALSRAGFRVVAPDQRGYNRSSKPRAIHDYHLDALVADVLALADACGFASFRLVGHDWGGLVGWWLAAQFPERIDRLAILNAPHPAVIGPYLVRHPKQMLKSSYIALFNIPRLPERILRHRGFRPLRRAMLATSRDGAFEPSDLDRYQDAWSQPGALTAMLNWYRALRYFSPRDRKTRVRSPTLVIWGRRDGFLKPGLAEESLRLCDEGRIHWLKEATHWLHLEDPDHVNSRLIDFLR